MDLDLHHPLPIILADETIARESLNQTRAWRACLILDHIVGTLCGKDLHTPGNGASDLDFSPSTYDLPGDVHAMARVAQISCTQQFMRRAREQVSWESLLVDPILTRFLGH